MNSRLSKSQSHIPESIGRGIYIGLVHVTSGNEWLVLL